MVIKNIITGKIFKGFFKKNILKNKKRITIKEKIVYKLIKISLNKFHGGFCGDGVSVEGKINTSPRGYIYIGEFKPKDIKNAVILVMENYVKKIDELIEELDHQFKSEARQERQFITFDQFKIVFERPEKLEGEKTRYQYSVKEGREVPKKSYYKYEDQEVVFPFKTLNRNEFLRTYSKNEEGYLKLLQSTNLKISSFFEKTLPYFVSENERKKHTFIMAGSGAGKSELIKILIYSTIIKNKNNGIVLLEPHGDLALQVAQFKYFKKNPERLMYIDFDIDTNYVPVINPFHLDEKLSRNIQTLTDALIKTFSALLKNEFSQRMETMLTYCLPVLLKQEHSTLLDLKRFVSIGDKADNQDLIDFGSNSQDETHKDYFENDFVDNKTLKSTKDGLRDRRGLKPNGTKSCAKIKVVG